MPRTTITSVKTGAVESLNLDVDLGPAQTAYVSGAGRSELRQLLARWDESASYGNVEFDLSNDSFTLRGCAIVGDGANLKVQYMSKE